MYRYLKDNGSLYASHARYNMSAMEITGPHGNFPPMKMAGPHGNFPPMKMAGPHGNFPPMEMFPGNNGPPIST